MTNAVLLASAITSNGNLNLTTSNAGITFNNSSALTNSTLNDYETGTWTPTFAGSGSNPTITYSTQNGYYTKIGNLVYLTFRIGVSSTSGGSGNLYLKGFPFTISSASNNFGTIQFGYGPGFTTACPTYGRYTAGNSFIELYYLSTPNTETGVTVGSLTSSSQLIMSMVYQATF